MTPIPLPVSNLSGRNSADQIQGSIPVSLSAPPVRSIGLYGDAISLIVPASDWGTEGPDGWDISRSMRITFGITGQTVTLDGYRLTRVVDYSRGGEIAESSPSGPAQSTDDQTLIVTLTTLPGFWRDGRGGVLRGGILNKLKADATIDVEDASYRLNSELVVIAIGAMGLIAGSSPGSLDDFDPPGPLDWHNASALLELEALLARIGHRAVFSNDGTTIDIVRLSRGGDDVVLPSPYDALAEPYNLYSAPPLRGRRVLVTSGTTRSTIVTSRSLASDPALEWVWFDDKTQRWLNDSETATLYPGTAQPGSIDDYQLGVTPDQTLAEFSRVFRAVRFGADDLDEVRRLAVVRDPVMFAGASVAGQVAVVKARGVKSELLGTQLRNEPVSGDAVTIDGAQVSPEHGVVVLPQGIEYVRFDPGPSGGRREAVALSGDDLTIYFAYESETGGYLTDTFVRGWSITDDVLTELSTMDRDDAIDDPETLRIEAPFLGQVLTNADGTDIYTSLNGPALADIAEQIAEVYLSGTLAKSGVIEIRGIHDIEPGSFGGVVSQVSWDLSGLRTVLSINQHEAPGSAIDLIELDAHRSFASGLGALDAPGTAVDVVSPRGVLPRDAGRSSSPARGAEEASAPSIRSSPLPPPSTVSSFVLARITGNNDLDPNKWTYDWEEVRIGADKEVEPVDGGRTSGEDGVAINPMESSNDNEGVEGNGVDRDNLPDGFAMQPIATGCVVLLIGPIDDGTDTLWLMLSGPVNSDDGECGGGS